MNTSPLSKFGLLFGLYLSQGVPHGFFFLAAPVILRERGLELETIALYSILSFPWMIKFATAPFIDRIAIPGLGHRRGWIILTQMATISSMLLLAFVPEDTTIKVIAYTMLLMNLASSTQDVATDGYAVSVLKDNERGWGNGIQLGGYFTGQLIGGGFMLLILKHLSWVTAFLLLAFILIIALLPVIVKRMTEHDHSSDPETHTKKSWATILGSFFKRKGVWVLIIMLILYRFPNGFTQTMLSTYIVDAGFERSQIGNLMSLGTLASVIGAALGGFLTTRMSRRKALLTFALLRIVAVAYLTGLSYLQITDHTAILIGMILDKLVYSMVVVALFAFMMDNADRHQGSSDYTLQDSFGVFAVMFSGAISGALSEVSYAFNFGTGLIASIAALLAVYFLFDKASHTVDNLEAS